MDSYAPAEIVTRAQTPTFVARLDEGSRGEMPWQPRDHFDDDDASVHHEEINQLADVGVVSGRTRRTFAPEAAASRRELATVLVYGIGYRMLEELPVGRDTSATTTAACTSAPSTRRRRPG